MLSRVNTYIFEEYEEYTVFIYEVLERRFPEKRKYFLDENAQIFLDTEGICFVIPDSNVQSDDMVRHIYKAPQAGVFSSLEIMPCCGEGEC